MAVIHHNPEDTVKRLKEAGCNRIENKKDLGYLADHAARTDPEPYLTSFFQNKLFRELRAF